MSKSYYQNKCKEQKETIENLHILYIFVIIAIVAVWVYFQMFHNKEELYTLRNENTMLQTRLDDALMDYEYKSNDLVNLDSDYTELVDVFKAAVIPTNRAHDTIIKDAKEYFNNKDIFIYWNKDERMKYFESLCTKENDWFGETYINCDKKDIMESCYFESPNSYEQEKCYEENNFKDAIRWALYEIYPWMNGYYQE